MAFQKLLLNSGLIFIVAIALFIGGSFGDDSALSNCTLSDNRLPGYIIPKHYNLRLVLDVDKEVQSDSSTSFLEHLEPKRAKHEFFFSGEIDVNIDILRSTQDIYFHVRKSIDIIDKSSTKLISSNGTEYFPIGNYDYFDAQIKVLRYNELLAGEYTLKIKFKNSNMIDINEINELFKASYKEETGEFSVFATRFQATGARGVFPCWDDPRFRSTFNISVKHRSKYRVLSNMPVKKGDVEEENEMRWTHFETTLPIPTYLVAITLNEFGDSDSINERISISSRPNVRNYTALANKVIEEVTSRLESKWKNMKKIPKMDHVAIPHFWGDGMSNTGLTLYREDILCVLRSDSVARFMEMVQLIGYNIAYQLFSTIVNPSWWSHLWINQGLSLLIGMEAIDEIFVHLEMMDLFIVQNQYESFKLNSYFAEARNQVDSPSEINSLLYMPHHFKASCLLLMLQHLLSRDVFWKGVQIYLDKHEFNSATSDNLWDAMQIALNEKNVIREPHDLKEVMNSWTQQKNYPVIIATLYDSGRVKISVPNFNEMDRSWIPLTYTTKSVSNFKATSITDTLWLGCNPKTPTATAFDSNPEVDNWIIVNLQQSGYYRVNYNDKNWLGIAEYLKTPNYMKIHVLNRAKIIDDAFYFMVEGKLNPSVFWDLTSYLSQETDFVAWYPMFKVFEHMSTILPFSDNKRVEKIKMKMYLMLDGVLKNTGYDEKSKKDKEDFTKRLMQEAAKWACIIRHPDCIEAAKNKNYEYLDNLEKKSDYSPLPWWKEWTFCYGSFDIERYELTNSLTPTSLLGCSGDDKAALVINHLQLIASRQDDEYTIVTSFHSIVARQSRNDEVLDYMLSNFDELKPRKNDMVAALIDIINHVYSKEQLMKISDFAKKHGTHHPLSLHLIPDVLKKISLRESQINDQIEYIRIWES